MCDKTQRPGALLNFMTKGKQEFVHLADPYDQVIFPHDSKVKQGCPNNSRYDFVAGKESTIDSVLEGIEPGNQDLRKKVLEWMNLCEVINDGFTALGLSRVLPTCLRFLVKKRIDTLYILASYTVRDVQYAVLNLGYTQDDLLRDCPKAPSGPDPDPSIRRLVSPAHSCVSYTI
jgi:hypothetical protein